MKTKEDPRYSMMELSITEYQIMKSSAVLNRLLDLKFADKYLKE